MWRLGLVLVLLMVLEGALGDHFLRGAATPAAEDSDGEAEIMDGGDPFPPPPKP